MVADCTDWAAQQSDGIAREPATALLIVDLDKHIDGLRRPDDALAESGRTEQHWYEAEMHRIPAEILLKRDPANNAGAEEGLADLDRYRAVAKARSFELRAALSLAKLYRAANRDADAYAVLAPAVEGFLPTQQFPETH